MKRVDLIRRFEAHGCKLVREGGKHSIFQNPTNGAISTVPRHREIKGHTARGICKDLGVPFR